MKQIDIQITKASIESFAVALGDAMPTVTATIALLAAGGKKISSFSISTNEYYGSVKFELPLTMIAPIQQIAHRLEEVVVMECNKALAQIEARPES